MSIRILLSMNLPDLAARGGILLRALEAAEQRGEVTREEYLDATELVRQLDDVAYREPDDADALDRLGAPLGGTRMTVESDRAAWQRGVVRLAWPRVDPEKFLADVRARVRVIVDLWEPTSPGGADEHE